MSKIFTLDLNVSIKFDFFKERRKHNKILIEVYQSDVIIDGFNFLPIVP